MSIDNRVVEMEFNNKQFESGIQESLKSLTSLEQGLQATGNVDALNALQQGVQGITDRFSTMGIIGMTALQEVTKSVINTTKQAASSVFGMVSTGGKQRAMNIEQAKFQFRGLGIDIEKAMEDSLYAVKGTAYGLDAAAKAASQLGASGIELGDDMKSALRGISGVAAMTNSDYESISRIFTTVAGQGKMMTMQLRQLENRGLNAAAVMAKSMGTTEAAVRDMVTDGKIDFETFASVMNEAFGPHATKANETFAGSLSNVKAALSRVGAGVWTDQLDNFRDIFNGLIPIIDGVFDAIEPLVIEFTKFSKVVTENLVKGIQKINIKPFLPLVLAFKNAFVLLGDILKPIKDAFREIFPPKTSQQIFEITNAIKMFTLGLKLSETTSNNIKRTFKGLFAVIDIGVMAVKAIAKGMGDLLQHLLPAADGLLDVTGNMGDFLVSVRDAIRDSEIFEKIVDNLGGVFGFLADGVRIAIDKIKGAFSSLSGSSDILGGIAGFIGGAFRTIVGIIEKVAPIVTQIAREVKEAFGNIWSGIKESFKSTEYTDVVTLANSGLIVTILYGIKKFIDILSGVGKDAGGVFKNLSGAFGGIKDSFNSFTGVLDGVRKSLEAYQSSLKANTLLKIAGAVGILAIALVVLASIDPGKLAGALGAMSVMLVELFVALSAMDKLMTGKKFKGLIKISGLMLTIATAVLLLSFALKKIGQLELAQVAKGIFGVSTLMVMLMAVMNNIEPKRMKSTSKGLIKFAVAINLLAIAVKKLGGLEIETLAKGLLGVGVLLASLAIFMNNTDFDGMSLSTGLGLIGMAVAINILYKAVEKFGELDPGVLLQGLGAMGAVLLALGLFLKGTGDAKGVVTTAIGLTILGAAMLIFAKAIDNMGSLDGDVIAKGLGTMAGALLIIGIAVKKMPKGMLKMGVSLTVVGAALLVLGKALDNMGGMSWEAIGKSILVLASSLAIIGVAVKVFQDSLAGAAAILIVSVALTALAAVLVKLGGMSMAEIGKSLLVLTGAFVVLGAAAFILTPVVPILLALGAALLLMAVSIAVLGGGLIAVSAGLTALAIAGSAGTAAVIGLITSVLKLIPLFVRLLGEAIVALVVFIGDAAPALIGAVSKILVALLDMIIDVAPKLGEVILVLIKTILDVIVEATPMIIQAGIDLLMALLHGIADNLQEVTETTVDIILAFIDGIANKLEDIIQSGINLILSFIEGLTKGISENKERMKNAITELFLELVDVASEALMGSPETFLRAGKIIIENVRDGIRNNKDLVVRAFEWLFEQISLKWESWKADFVELGKFLMQGLAEGIKAGWGWVKTALGWVGRLAVSTMETELDINSPSKVFEDKIGKQIPAGMAKGIEKGAPKVEKAASEMAKTSFEATKEWIDHQKKYHSLSLEEEQSKWKSIQGEYAEDSKERLDIDLEIRNIEKERIKESYDYSKKWMDNEKFYDRMTKKEELEGWKRMQDKYLEGTEERIEADKQVYTLGKEVRKEALDSSKKWMDEEKHYNRLTVQEELDGWKRVQKAHKIGTDERKEANRQVYTHTKNLNKKRFEDSKKWIDNEKHYDKMTKLEELNSWKRMQTQHRKGSDERIEIDKKIYTMKKEQIQDLEQLDKDYYQSVTDINQKLKDDVKSLNDGYDDALKSRADSIMSSYGLFDKIEEIEEPITGAEMLENLTGQVDVYRQWQKDMNTIANKGIGGELLAELEAMGPSAAESIHALATMGSGQLSKYASLYATKQRIANEQAVKEMKDLKKDTVKEIAGITEDSESELNDLEIAWAESTEKISGGLEQVAIDMALAFVLSLNDMRGDSNDEFQELANDANTILGGEQWDELGGSIIDGLVKGIDSNSGKLMSTMISMSKAAIDAAEATLGVHSPSKEFARIGMYTVLGMVKGVKDNVKQIAPAMRELGSTAIKSMNDTFSAIADIVNTDMILEPTIRPVIDMTDVDAGLASAFGGTQGINTTNGRNHANHVSSFQNRGNNGLDATTTDGGNNTVTNEFTVHATIREEADIRKVSEGLFKLQNRAMRGRGINDI